LGGGVRTSSPIPDVTAWARRENAATERALAHLRDLRSEIAAELLTRAPGPLDLPLSFGAWDYRVIESSEAWHLDRRPRGSLEPWRTVHEIALSPEEGFFSLGALEPSDDGRFLAMSFDRVGDERFHLELHDLERDSLVCGIPNVVHVAWAADGRTLFATIRSDAPYRAFALLRIDAASGLATTVWEERDPLCRLALRRSDSGALVFLDRLRNHSSKIPAAAETWCVRSDRPGDEFRVLVPESPGVSYQAEHLGEDLYLRINDTGPYFRVLRAPFLDGVTQPFGEVVSQRPGIALAELRTLRNHLVLLTRRSGLAEVDVLDPDGRQLFTVHPDEAAYSLVIGHERPGGRPLVDYQSARLRLTFSSFVTPTIVDELDAATGLRVARWQQAVPGHDPNAYVVERRHAPAIDATPIPVSILRRAAFDAPAPLLLHGYGAYGFWKDAAFDRWVLRLVDRGVTFALAHVRGGGELGGPWHDAARRRTKHVSVQDFIAVAEHLVRSGIASEGRLVSRGKSAGGALVAAALNDRPDLFAGVVALMPLADLLACQSDETMPFSINERQEWGDPIADERDRVALTAICPTTNATSSPTPAVFVTAAIHDGQVRYWQPSRYVDAIRSRRRAGDPVLLRVLLEGGHQGPSRPGPAAEEGAVEMAFVLDRLGLVEL
jgi:oligopeptidase B